MVDTTPDTTQEQRRFKRIDFVDAVQVIRDDVDGAEASSWETQCIDISMCGMLLELPENFPIEIGTPFEVELILSEDIIIEMPCTLVHVENHHAGFRAERMNLESMTNLRRLLELNLADNSLVEREINSLIQMPA